MSGHSGFITGKLLSILDKLDRYNFNRAETSPAIDQIYNTIMSIWNEKTNNEVSSYIYKSVAIQISTLLLKKSCFFYHAKPSFVCIAMSTNVEKWFLPA